MKVFEYFDNMLKILKQCQMYDEDACWITRMLLLFYVHGDSYVISINITFDVRRLFWHLLILTWFCLTEKPKWKSMIS